MKNFSKVPLFFFSTQECRGFSLVNQMWQTVSDRVRVWLRLQVSLSWYQDKTKIEFYFFTTLLRELQKTPASTADLSIVRVDVVTRDGLFCEPELLRVRMAAVLFVVSVFSGG
jgi:hypothetical protein